MPSECFATNPLEDLCSPLPRQTHLPHRVKQRSLLFWRVQNNSPAELDRGFSYMGLIINLCSSYRGGMKALWTED